MFPTPKAKMMNYRWFSISDIVQGVQMGLMSPMDAQFYINLFQNLLMAVKNGDVSKVKEMHNNIYNLQKMYSKPILPSGSARIIWVRSGWIAYLAPFPGKKYRNNSGQKNITNFG